MCSPAIRSHRSPLARVRLMTDPSHWMIVLLSSRCADCHIVFLPHFAKAIRQLKPVTLGGTD